MLRTLVKAINKAANKYIYLNFNLILKEALNEVLRAAIIRASPRARLVTATMI
jgi:hypothetical protein